MGGRCDLTGAFLKATLKVLENPKFFEHGLEVVVAQKLGAHAVIYDVHCRISADELMQQIHDHNDQLEDNMSFEQFKKEVKIASRLIRLVTQAVNNAVIKDSRAGIDKLTSTEREREMV